MHIYLPIAEVPINWMVLIGLGMAVGVLSGMLGVSGGFITTPLLMFFNIPAGVAVASQASPVAASSFVGALRQGGRNSVDYKMGLVLMAGGLGGSSAGVYVFQFLQRTGQIDFTVTISYIVLLGSIGSMMLSESLRTIGAAKRGAPVPAHKPGNHTWLHNLPFKMRFRASRLYISAIPVVVLGFAVGVMTAILGTGGAFILIPAKVYLLRMRTNLAIGTSQFQMFIVACMTTMMHAMVDKTVDIVLSLILVVGAVAGAQIGSTLGAKLKGEELRMLLALLTLAIAARLLYGVVSVPVDTFSMTMGPYG